MRRLRFYIRSVAGLLLFFALYIQAAALLFSHVHVVNGSTIVHSHPYCPGTSHEHSAPAYQLVDLLSHPSPVLPEGTVLPAPVPLYPATETPALPSGRMPSAPAGVPSGRAPPVS